MTTIIRHKLPNPKMLSRGEFLTPFDRMFDDILYNMFPAVSKDLGDDFFLKGSYPKVNVINESESLVIEAAIPGMKKDDVEVQLQDGVLTIKGSSNQNKKESQYIKREIKRSSFRRSFRLEDSLDHNGITASYDNGILVLTIPKLKPEKKDLPPKTIQIS